MEYPKNKPIVTICKALLLCTLSFQLIRCQRNPNAQQQEVINQAKQHFVFVKGGTFIMGSESMRSGTVQVSLDSYSMSKYETTFKEYDVYCEITGAEKPHEEYRDVKDLAPNYGVKKITWYLARDYCLWLGKQLNLPIDLPTEAQWEYAARSRGLVVEHATNSGKIEGGDRDNYGTDREVGGYPPNPLGLYDMSGGRPEWVFDYKVSYARKPVVNPRYDTIRYSRERVVRGWHKLQNSVYYRGMEPPEVDGGGVGFRCACNQKTPIE